MSYQRRVKVYDPLPLPIPLFGIHVTNNDELMYEEIKVNTNINWDLVCDEWSPTLSARAITIAAPMLLNVPRTIPNGLIA